MAVTTGSIEVSLKVDIVGGLAESLGRVLTPDSVRELASALTRIADAATDAAASAAELVPDRRADPAGRE